MEYILEQFAISVAAITGVLAARGKQLNLFGVLVLALVTAVGGGTVRDVLLGDFPVFWTADQSFMLNAALTAIVTFYLMRYQELPRTVLMVADAFALALFTIIGTRKGLVFEVKPAIAIMMGLTTAVFGGILRDLLIGEIPLVLRREVCLHATAAFGGASGFVLLQRCSQLGAKENAVLGASITLLLRLAGIRWRIRLPAYRPRNPEVLALMQPKAVKLAGSVKNHARSADRNLSRES